MFPVGCNSQRTLPIHLKCRRAYEGCYCDWIAPSPFFFGSQLVISDRVTECGRQGGSEFAPTEPWSLAGQGDRSPLRCHRRVRVCVCAYRSPVAMTTTSRQRDLVCGCAFVGGWLGALATFEYFCIFVICLRQCTCSAHHVSLLCVFVCVCLPDPASAGAGRGSGCDARQGAEL